MISQDCVAIITNYCGNDTVGLIKMNINFKENPDSFSPPASAGLRSVLVPLLAMLLFAPFKF